MFRSNSNSAGVREVSVKEEKEGYGGNDLWINKVLNLSGSRGDSCPQAQHARGEQNSLIRNIFRLTNTNMSMIKFVE